MNSIRDPVVQWEIGPNMGQKPSCRWAVSGLTSISSNAAGEVPLLEMLKTSMLLIRGIVKSVRFSKVEFFVRLRGTPSCQQLIVRPAKLAKPLRVSLLTSPLNLEVP